MQSEKKWYQFWKRNNVSEVNSAVTQDDHIHEFNTSLESAYINMLCGSSESPYTIQEIRAFTKNPRPGFCTCGQIVVYCGVQKTYILGDDTL